MEKLFLTATAKVGHPEIDRQHEELITVINALIDMMDTPDDSDAFLDQMQHFHDLLAAHYNSEESLMADMGVHGLDDHQKRHAAGLASVAAAIEDVRARGCARMGDIVRLFNQVVDDVLKGDSRLKVSLLEQASSSPG